MSDDTIALLETRGSRPPTFGETRLKNFVGIGRVVPHGDRSNIAKSASAEDNRSPVSPLRNNVVCKFVLGYNVGNNCWGDRALRLVSPPAKHIG
jgi:hypothetical protein